MFGNKKLEEMANIYARLVDKKKFKYQTVFRAMFFIFNDYDEISDTSVVYINSMINQKLTESGIDNINPQW